MCAALYGESSTTQALTATTIEKNCKALTVCYKGGSKSVPCTISQTDCPACVTFNDGGCYEKQADGTCSFGSLCSTYWDEDTSTSAGSGSAAAASAKSAASHGSAGVSTAGKNTTGSNSTTKTSTSSHASAAGTGTAGSSASDSKGSDMSVVFAIIGAAMGVIAVAVIFLTLVRRSRAAHEDEDDVATPPAAMGGGKEPVSTTAAVTYASYDRNRGTSGAGGAALASVAEPSVVSYYSQQPKDLPIASPRVAGRAVPAAAAAGTTATTTSVASYYAQQPQNLPAVSPRVAGRAVPAASRAVPPPAPAARAMPVFANKAPLNNPHQQQQQQETVYHQAPVAAQVQVQEAPRRVSSPRNRRESFEF